MDLCGRSWIEMDWTCPKWGTLDPNPFLPMASGGSSLAYFQCEMVARTTQCPTLHWATRGRISIFAMQQGLATSVLCFGMQCFWKGPASYPKTPTLDLKNSYFLIMFSCFAFIERQPFLLAKSSWPMPGCPRSWAMLPPAWTLIMACSEPSRWW